MMTPEQPEMLPTVFEASIVPYRSLGRTGVVVLLSVLTLLVSLIVVRFWLLGAWPVVLFSVLEVPLVVLLLWLNMRARRTSEMILVTARDVTVTRTDWGGRRSSFCMSTAWLRIDQQTTGGASRLLLRTHGSEREIGSFLHEADRESLYLALCDAMHAVRSPSFDNAQLRDDATG